MNNRPLTASRAQSGRSGPISVNHALRPDFSVCNKIAYSRTDCRRQMGLGPLDNGSQAAAAEPIYAGASLKGHFKITRAGIIPEGPAYSMPKDTQQSFLAYYERKGKRTPGPDEHSKELSWNNRSSKFGAGGDRKTFCDEAIAHSKEVPGPEEYDPMVYQWAKTDDTKADLKYQHIPLGKME